MSTNPSDGRAGRAARWPARGRPVAASTALAAGIAAGLAGCGGDGGGLPRLSAAQASAIAHCTDLAGIYAHDATLVDAVEAVPAGTLAVAGQPIASHCRVTGRMNLRQGAIDGQTYAIGFEMRLPDAWNGRLFYQANGGLNGVVVTATGGVNGGFGATNALHQGFAVISSDAGHANEQNPAFGIDPQARLDYGYQAAATLTPMAKELVRAAYGRLPDRSYFGGCSNGGRQTMVAASRMPGEYDGYLVGNPGFRLPYAAIANVAAYQGWLSQATDPADASTGLTADERGVVARAVLARCDALDGLADGLVQDTKSCKAQFDIARDVPSCAGARDGTCLTDAQKGVVARRFAGVTDGSGRVFYASWPWDAGIGGGNTASWYFTSPWQRDAPAIGLVWSVPPADPATFDGKALARSASVDTLLAQVVATDATYTENAVSFMQPPDASNLDAMRDRGAKMMVYHGTSDPIFSSDDTAAWYDALAARHGNDASDHARYYAVPGMTHCSAGPATDQFDMLTPLVAWVEQGVAPERVVATARGAGNAVAVNPDVPADWSAARTRPLCPYPKVARYDGSGDIEAAASFTCR